MVLMCNFNTFFTAVHVKSIWWGVILFNSYFIFSFKHTYQGTLKRELTASERKTVTKAPACPPQLSNETKRCGLGWHELIFRSLLGLGNKDRSLRWGKSTSLGNKWPNAKLDRLFGFNFFLKGQTRPLFVYFRSFHLQIQVTNIHFELYKLKKA